MLTRNIDTEDGLVDGAFGSVTGVHLDAHEQVTAVNVKFDNDKTGKKHLKKSVIIDASLKGSVRIKLFQDNLYGKKFIRKQIPLTHAWAATIHKVQGMTVQQIVVSLRKIFKPGMAYVALSRATTLSGLVILVFNPNAIYSSEDITEALQQMPIFHSPQLVPAPSNLFTIVHHNTEGFLTHLSDVKAMKQFQRANVICFTETWLSKRHTLDATLYPEYTRYNLKRSEAYNKENIFLSEKINMNRGGVAIFVKHSFPQQNFLFETQNLEVVDVIVNNAVLLTIYRPPSYPLKLFIENFKQLLQEMQQLSLPSIIVGDFNNDAFQSGENKVVNMFKAFGYTKKVDFPTTEGETCLDLVFVHGFVNNCTATILQTFYGYHDAVKMDIEIENNIFKSLLT